MSATRLGVFASSLADERLDAAAAVDRAARLGFDACLFGSVFEISARLDAAEVADLRDHAAGRGVEVAVGSVNLHPFRFAQDARLLAAGDGDAMAGYERMLTASGTLAGRDLLAIIGRIEDRYDTVTPWADQLAATAGLLGRLAPVLRAHGLRLALKTHEEITCAEVLRLVDAVGPETVTASLDPVTLLVNLDDPVESAARLGTAVRQVVLDDAVLVLRGDRGVRLLCAVGDGVVDWDGLGRRRWPAPVAWWVELHRGQFDAAPFDAGWLAAHPDLTPLRLAAGMRHVVRGHHATPPERVRALRAGQARPTVRLAASTRAARRLLQLPGPRSAPPSSTERNRHHEPV